MQNRNDILYTVVPELRMRLDFHFVQCEYCRIREDVECFILDSAERMVIVAD